MSSGADGCPVMIEILAPDSGNRHPRLNSDAHLAVFHDGMICVRLAKLSWRHTRERRVGARALETEKNRPPERRPSPSLPQAERRVGSALGMQASARWAPLDTLRTGVWITSTHRLNIMRRARCGIRVES